MQERPAGAAAGGRDVDVALELLELARDVEAHVGGPDSEAWIARLERRSEEIRPAVDVLLAADRPDAALDLAGALSVFWQDVGRVDEGRRLTQGLLDSLPEHPRTRALGRAHLVLGELAFRQGDQGTAATATTAAGSIGAELQDGWLIGRAELNLARVAFRDGDADRIRDHAQRVLEVAGDSARLRGGGMHMLGWAEYTAGNVSAAMRHFEENVARCRQAGDRIGEASELANLGDLAMESGDLAAAGHYLHDALSVEGVRENLYLAPSLIRSAGVLAVLQGSHTEGLELIAASERQYEELGLVPDPGDELTPEVRRTAEEALGEEARAVELRGRERSLEDAASLAMTCL